MYLQDGHVFMWKDFHDWKCFLEDIYKDTLTPELKTKSRNFRLVEKQYYPLKSGFGHFGVINGQKTNHDLFIEHEAFMKKFRTLIKKYYYEKPKTRYIVEKIKPYLMQKIDLSYYENPIIEKIILAIVYGMMVSLGYRTIPKEEMKYIK